MPVPNDESGKIYLEFMISTDKFSGIIGFHPPTANEVR